MGRGQRFFKFLVLLGVTILLFGCGGKAAKPPDAPKPEKPVARDYHQHSSIVPVMPEVLTDGDVGWQKIDENTERKIYFNDRLTMEVIRTAKPELTKNVKTRHQYNDLLGYVIQGSALVTVDKSTKTIGTGGVFVVPSNVSYDVIPASDQTVILNVYTPARDDLRPAAPVKAQFNDNEIKRTVYDWFAGLDARAGIGNLLSLLAEKNLNMTLSDKTVIRSWQDFQTWYAAWLAKTKSSVHRVESLSVSYDNQGHYPVVLTVSWKVTTTDGKTQQGKSQQNWVLTEAWGNHPRIADFR
jgi:mannose-6-phosphate isomerase-like protein (cupin superfamily)